ncbi:MAG: tetratricopeptide repeat protein [Candidatus Dasytiphilus stammeri]
MVQYLLSQKKKSLFWLIFFTFVLLFIGVFWYHQKLNHIANTSVIYQKNRQFLKNNNSVDLKINTAKSFINYNNHIYDTFISLNLAKRYIENNDFFNAEVQLTKGLKTISDVNMQTILKLRLARIQLQQKKIDEALYTLKSIKTRAWRDLVAEIQGNAWFKKGDCYQAYQFWSESLAVTSSPILRKIMKLKINNLPLSVKKNFSS